MKRVRNLLKEANAISVWLTARYHDKNVVKLNTAIKEVEAMVLSKELVALKKRIK